MVHVVHLGAMPLHRRESIYQRAVNELAAAQKSGAGVPAYLRWVNRGLGRRAAALAFRIGLTPNQVTLASALLSAGALLIVVALPISWGTATLAAVLLLAGFALDSADGQLARLTKSGSPSGEWLDHVVDATRQPLIHLAIAVHLFQSGQPVWTVAAALVFLVVSSVWFFAQTLAEKLSPPAGLAPEAPPWVSFIKLPYDPAVLYVSVAFLAVPVVFLSLYLTIFLLTAAVAALSLLRKYHALEQSAARVAPVPAGTGS